MFRTLMFMHWKTARPALLVLVPLCLGLPIFVTRLSARVSQNSLYSQPLDLLQMLQLWAPFYPLLAALTGVTLALTAWNWDHRSNHVYALSLPLPRWEYVLLKMGAGALLLALPVAAVLIGSMIASWSTPLPEGLVAYPFSFSTRFMFAALLTYALLFSLAAGTVKTTTRVLFGAVMVFVFGTIFVGFLRETLQWYWLETPFTLLLNALLEWPGPFSVFGGSWMLIDV